jgi:hypothetical protein
MGQMSKTVMKFRLLERFVAAADELNFTHAARSVRPNIEPAGIARVGALAFFGPDFLSKELIRVHASNPSPGR